MRRRSIALIAAVAGLATVAGVAPATSRAAAELSCANPQYVEAVGLACRTPDGLWEIVTEDGYRTTTHGPDYVQPIHGMAEMLRVRRRQPSCVNDPSSEYHIQIIYTTTIDYPDRYGQRLSYLRRMLERVNGMLYREGAEFRRPMRYRMSCVNGRISVINAKLPISSGPNQGALGGLDPANFTGIVTALRREGYTNPLAKYWLFVDTPAPFPGLGGIASFLNDDRLLANNASNFGPGYGVFWDVGEAFTTEAMMHEAAHLHGAVAYSAPNSSGAGHCLDDSDVMCYADNAATASQFQWAKCRRLHFDCGHNDYFNPRPRRGSYLANNWNLGSPLNRFFAGCLYQTDQVTAGTAGVDVDSIGRENVDGWSNISTRSHAIPRRCRGRDFALTGSYSPQPREADRVVGVAPDTHLALFLLGAGPPDHLVNLGIPRRDELNQAGGPDFNVCFYRGSRQLSCFSEIGTDQGRVPRTATRAVVSFNAGVRGIYILSII